MFEVFHRMELLQVEQLTFEQAKEVFCDCIVQAVSFSAHTLPDTFCLEHLLVLLVLVLPALVRVENQSGTIRYGCKSFVEHGCYHAQHRSVRDGIADQIPIVQIQDGRKIELLAKQTELRHIGDPLLVWPFCMEVPV